MLCVSNSGISFPSKISHYNLWNDSYIRLLNFTQNRCTKGIQSQFRPPQISQKKEENGTFLQYFLSNVYAFPICICLSYFLKNDLAKTLVCHAAVYGNIGFMISFLSAILLAVLLSITKQQTLLKQIEKCRISNV